MSSESQLYLAQVVYETLVKHFQYCRENNIPRYPLQHPKGYLISYGTLGSQTNIEIDPRSVAGPLYDISAFCALHKLKPIHSLVVRKKEGWPGAGYFRAVGTEVEELDEGKQLHKWNEWVNECIESGEFPQNLRIAP